ncbi:MDR family MFS transporter [Micromonospora sp. PTRAS2]|nr:MDR family MFS transporter [Micromonospora haikouensis]
MLGNVVEASLSVEAETQALVRGRVMLRKRSTEPRAAGGDAPLPKELQKIAVVVLVGLLLMQLDGTMVGIALNTLSGELSVSVSTLQWVVTGYLLALMVGMPIAGWAADRFGTRRMWTVSLVVFLVGSVLCGVAVNIETLIFARVVQGLGGGMMVPVGQAMLMRVAGAEHRARLVGLMAIPGVIGPTLGPVVGGVIVDDFSWRWMFLINIPIGLIAFFLAGRNLPNFKEEARAALDVLGVVLLVPGLVAVVFGLSRAAAGGLGDPLVVAPLVTGVVLIAGFILHAARPNIEALVSMRLFKYRNFAAASALTLLAALTMGAGIVQPLFLQQVHGESPMGAGLLLVGFGVGSALTSVVLSRVFNRLGARLVGTVGLALTFTGTVAFTQFYASTGRVFIVLAMLLSGVGLAMVTLTMSTALYVGLPPQQIARATGASRIVQQLGLSTGTAVISLVLQIQLTKQTAGSDLDSLANAYHHAFWWSAGFLALAIVPALLLPGRIPATPGAQDKKVAQAQPA